MRARGRRLLGAVVAAAVALTLAACGGSDDPVATQTTSPPAGSTTIVPSGVVVELLEAGAEPLEGLQGTVRVDDRGRPIEVDIDIPTEGLPADLAEVLEQVESQLASSATPFPDDAVGVGARWTVVTPLVLVGVAVRQEITYTLVGRDGDTYRLSTKQVQTAPAGTEVKLSTIPAGASMTVDQWDVVGDGTVEASLRSPLPVSSTSDASGTQRFQIDQDGRQATLEQEISVEVSIRQG